MAKGLKKKISSPVTVTVVYDDSEVVFTEVFSFDEDDDGTLTINRNKRFTRVRPDYRYYEIVEEDEEDDAKHSRRYR